MEAVLGPEALGEVAVGHVHVGDAAARADGRGGLRLGVRPLSQHAAQGPHEDGTAVELPGGADHHVPGAAGGVVQDGLEVLLPLRQGAAGQEVVGAGAHQQDVGLVHLGQESVPDAAHGRAEPGVGGPGHVLTGASGQEAGDTRGQGLALAVHPGAGHQGVPDRLQAQGALGAGRGQGAAVGGDDAGPGPGRLRGQVHGALGDDGLGHGDGAPQETSDTAWGTDWGGGSHGPGV